MGKKQTVHSGCLIAWLIFKVLFIFLFLFIKGIIVIRDVTHDEMIHDTGFTIFFFFLQNGIIKGQPFFYDLFLKQIPNQINKNKWCL